MEFRDYAIQETSAVIGRLLDGRSASSLEHLRVLRDAVDAAAKAVEATATPTEIEQDIRELVRRLTTAASAAARTAAQRIQEEARVTLEAVQADLDTERARNAEVNASIGDLERQLGETRSDLSRQTERADSIARDLEAAVEASRQIDAMRQESEALVRSLEDSKASVEDQLRDVRGLLESAVSESDRLAGQLDAVSAENSMLDERLSSITGSLERSEAERTRADAANHELSQSRTALEHELQGVREALDVAVADAARLTSELEAALAEASRLISEFEDSSAEAARLRSELETLSADNARLHAELAASEEERHAILTDRDAVSGELHASRARAEELERHQVSLEDRLHDTESKLTVAAEAETRWRDQANISDRELAGVRAERDAITEQLHASRARVDMLERGHVSTEDSLRHVEQQLQSAADAESRWRDQAAAAEQDIVYAREEIDALGAAIDRMASLFDASVRGVDELASAATVSELFARVATELATQFPRVAIFRLKGKRLEGEHQFGFDKATDVTKLVIPINVDSLLTRAAGSGLVERLMDGAPDESHVSPFGTTPAAAIALPIVLHGETLAIAYVEESDAPAPSRAARESSAAFATLMVRHAVAHLMRLTRELKTLTELRDYAAMLLQEAEQMYSADVDAGRSEEEMVRRLKDTVECARQLYAQRAALEGSAAATLLDDQIAAIVDTDSPTPFTRHLGSVVGRAGSSRRAAEAS